jgi:hypothetical protein
LFGFDEHVHEVSENREAEEEQSVHGCSDFFEEIDGFEKQAEQGYSGEYKQ